MRIRSFVALTGALLTAALPAHAHPRSTGDGTLSFRLDYSGALGATSQPRSFTGADLGGGSLALECAWETTGALHWAGPITTSGITGGGSSETLTSGFGSIGFAVSGAGALEMDMPGGAKYANPRATFSAQASGSYIRSTGSMFVSVTLSGTTVDPDGALSGFAPIACPDSTLIAQLAAAPYAEPQDVLDSLPPTRFAQGDVRRIVLAGQYQFTDG